MVPSRVFRHTPTPLHISIGRREAALAGEIEQGVGLPRAIARAVAQVLGDGGTGHDVARGSCRFSGSKAA